MNTKLTLVSYIVRGKRYSFFQNLPTAPETRMGNADIKSRITPAQNDSLLGRCAKMERGETYTIGG